MRRRKESGELNEVKRGERAVRLTPDGLGGGLLSITAESSDVRIVRLRDITKVYYLMLSDVL